MKKKLKIAIYSGTIPSTTFIENLIKGISTKHEILLFGKLKSNPKYASENIHFFPIFSNNVQNLLYTKWRTFILLLKYPKRVQILWKEVKQVKGLYNKYNWWSRNVPVLLNVPDIFHIQWAKDIEKWIFLKEKLGVKLVLSLRGAHINYSPIANKKLAETYKKYFSKIDAFHAVSASIGLEAQKYGDVAAKITTIHSLISNSTFELFELPEVKIGHKLHIISVGRHHWKKGYTMALDACKLLKENNIDFKYTIIAAGSIPEVLVFQRHQLGLLDEVVFMNALPQEEVFGKMQGSDVLLLPSLEEGIANVVLEAMALGLPVISTNCGGMAEVIINGETGWLVPEIGAEEMALALKKVDESTQEERQKIAKNAHDLVRTQFGADKNIELFNELYLLVTKL